jgi:hypothetical protein
VKIDLISDLRESLKSLKNVPELDLNLESSKE